LTRHQNIFKERFARKQKGTSNRCQMCALIEKLFLFMSVFAKSLLALVGSHFMALSFFTAWHFFKF
jgi:hypothetical protein